MILPAYRNIVGQFLGVVCSLSPFLGILYMQSSINTIEGLGLLTNATSFSTLIISIFAAPFIVSVAGTKPSLCLSSIIFTIYTLSNFYPHWFTLLPAAALTGLALGLLWVAMYSHATATALKFHDALKENKENCTVLLASTTGVSVQLAGMVGASVSSIVLLNLKTTVNYNDSFIDNDTSSCGVYEEGHEVSDVLYYPLIGIYALLNIISLFVILVFVDNFKSESEFVTMRTQLYASLKSLISCLFNVTVILLFPMFTLHGLLLGYVTGDFSKVN